jgi:hypothetical protein
LEVWNKSAILRHIWTYLHVQVLFGLLGLKLIC